MTRIISIMRRLLSGALIIAALAFTVSCERNDVVDYRTTRTVLVYMAADNNLTDNANPNVLAMKNAMNTDMEYANLLVFIDKLDAKPVLLHLHDLKIDTLKVYDELNSADGVVLRSVIKNVLDNWKAETYGLILWSHGMGWIPGSYSMETKSRAPMREEYLTKYFANNNHPDGSPQDKRMEIDELADAIPDGVFDYIAFDACYMGAVEVAYALRKKADYIISSSCEIISNGFPYKTVIRDFLSGNITKVCRDYHAHYDAKSGFQRTASISLVKTDALDSLARCFKKIVAAHKEEIPQINPADLEIQYFDRLEKHVMFDLEDFIDKLGTDYDDLTEFRLQLEKCVIYKNSTPYICSDYEDERYGIKMNTFCGLSVYIPLQSFDEGGLNAEYRKTEWSRDTGY